MKPQMANMSFYARYVSIHLVPLLSRLTALNWQFWTFSRGRSEISFEQDNKCRSGWLVWSVWLVWLVLEELWWQQTRDWGNYLHCRLLFLNQQQYIWCFIQTKILNISLDISLGKTDKKVLEPWWWENMIQRIISNRMSMIISIWGFTPSLHRFPPLLFVPYLSVRLCVARTMVIRRQILLFSLEQNPINPG